MSARAWDRRRWRSRIYKLSRRLRRAPLGTVVSTRLPGGAVVRLSWHPDSFGGGAGADR